MRELKAREAKRPQGVLPLESRLVEWARGSAPLAALYRCLPLGLREAMSRLSSRRLQDRLSFARTPAWGQPLPMQPRPAPATSDAASGINLFGYLRGQFGLGESARQYARALMADGLQVALVDLDLDLPHGWADDSLESLLGSDAPFPISLIFVNPDYLDVALAQIGPERLRGRCLFACWFWELDRVPSAWVDALAKVDGLIVASRFIEEAFRAVTDKPILRAPLPLAWLPDSGLQRMDFGLAADEFVFLVSFDFNSWVARKNPIGALQAFRLAFPDPDAQVRLVVKTSNGFRYPNQLHALLVAAAGDSRITIRDDIIERAHMTALLRCCDAYVSLHRAEGFGLGMAEAMSLGKPVVATAWSGNLDFMTPDVACLVDYRLAPVALGEYPDAAGACWAEPDVDAAAGSMRALADDPLAAVALGARARAHVARVLAPAASAAAIRQGLAGFTAAHSQEVLH